MTVQAAGLLDTPERETPRVRLPLVSQFLELQQDLTAVERFSRRHEADELPPGERVYQDLIPLAKPAKGQQYAFQVDLDACTGCKACVTACHRLNGLDDDEAETWRTVGLLHGGTSSEPVQQTVTTACHHCVDPACMKGCPVKAYEKDPVTGIVKHLDDQCIGCQYCTLTCPYEVPQYNPSRGIVRKCDMCSGRLAAGEAPACVQACPQGAITITVVDTARAIEDAQADTFLPGAPSPGITVPTTAFKTREALPRNLAPADFHSVHPAHNHLPLVFMLVLTQLAVGTLVVERALAAIAPELVAPFAPITAPLALVAAAVALAASTLHLGRPLYAFRALRGVGHSWVSREIVAFGAFAGVAALHAITGGRHPALGNAAAGLGLAGVICSVQLYAVTGRAWWSTERTLVRFGGTAIVLGLAAVLAVAAARDATELLARLTQALMIVLGVKLAAELAVLGRARDHAHTELRRTALLLRSHLRRRLTMRVVLAIAGLLLAAAATAPAAAPLPWAVAALLALTAGELLERNLYFAASAAPRMPGAFA
jgi:Fe-S-cluster-containing dehydrogenase component